MSASRPKINRNAATVSENTLAGHVRDASGISRSTDKVGNKTVKPETKYSYLLSEAVGITGLKISPRYNYIEKREAQAIKQNKWRFEGIKPYAQASAK